MTYKYAPQLAALGLTLVQCPCQEAAPRAEIAYRLVSLPIENEVNFVPRTLVPGVPRKIKTVPNGASQAEIEKIEHEVCNDWAISLHTDPEASRRIGKRFKKLGTHLAALKLREEHGQCTPTDENQHFNLHEAADADLRLAVTQVQPL